MTQGHKVKSAMLCVGCLWVLRWPEAASYGRLRFDGIVSMEKLKSLVPDSLKRSVAESSADDLPSTCSSLLHFFQNLPQFHHIVEDLADPQRALLCAKNKHSALQSKLNANHFFSISDYPNALSSYSKALREAPLDADDSGKNLVATLYLNRASLLHKMGLLVECLRDCNRALQIYPTYAKAWYRRGKVNASMVNYEDAARDLTMAKTVELSSGGRKQIETELEIVIEQKKKTSNSVVQNNEQNFSSLDESPGIHLQKVITPDKGRGMSSPCDIPQATLVHREEPYAMVILKQCRETHCHYCLDELPVDKVPCPSCSIPFYCSQNCQARAGGQMLRTYPKIHENLSNDLEKYVAESTSVNYSDPDMDSIHEHSHECLGLHWPAILPPDIVLAGRVLAKSIASKKGSALMGTLELAHSYAQLPPESKLELHVYSIVLSYCLQHSHKLELQIDGASISQIVILLSQIRVNSIAIVRMKSVDAYQIQDGRGALTSNVEQVRVGQALYAIGSLFNHSCQPNIHAYFISRTLFIRTTEFVAVGCPLELSYGPQVGQWDCKDRLKFLEHEYSFRCQCRGCTEVNLSDLVLNAFHCVHPDCSGIVLDSSVLNCEKQKNRPCRSSKRGSLEPHLQVDMPNISGISKLDPGYCLMCGSYRDLKSSSATVDEAWIYIRRLQETVVSKGISSSELSDAMESFSLLRSTLHTFNKGIAEAEDIIAQACCLMGKLQPAMDHCKASIKILEKLYYPTHIVIGYELVKLSSIQLALGDRTVVECIDRLCAIFSRYFGSHADMLFPYLQSLKAQRRSMQI